VCELYSYRKVYLDIKITRRVYDFYMLFDEASPYLPEDVYEVLILWYWCPLSIEHHNSCSINLDTKQDPIIVVDTHIHIKCWICLLSNWREENRVKVLTWSCTATEWMYKYAAIQSPAYIVLGPLWPSVCSILVYNIWVQEADVIVPLSLAFFHLHPTRYKKNRGWEST
jgi:hypothetical protein